MTCNHVKLDTLAHCLSVCGLQVLYVLYFDREAEPIRAVSVTEFLLAHPCLNLAVFHSAASHAYRQASDSSSAGLSGPVDPSSSHGRHFPVLYIYRSIVLQ